jgi:hypothetical protein
MECNRKDEAKKSLEIDKYLAREKKRMALEVKLLFLGQMTEMIHPYVDAGATGSGKSTIMSQMKIYQGGYSIPEKMEMIPIIVTYTWQSIRALICKAKLLNISIGHQVDILRYCLSALCRNWRMKSFMSI